MMETPLTPERAMEKLRVARLVARLAYPEYSYILFRVSLIIDPTVGTAAADRYGRVYFDPAFVAQYDETGLAFFLVHEVTHILRHHAARAEEVCPHMGAQMHDAANIAMDAVIHETMLSDYRLAMPDREKWVTLDKYNLAYGLTWEEHFVTLLERAQDSDPDQGAGSGRGQGDEQAGRGGSGVQTPNCGSAATGRVAPWERGAPTSESGMSESELNEVRKQVAQDIQDRAASRGRGTVPSHMQRWAEEILDRRIDPTRAIRQLLTHYLGAVASTGTQRTYSRRNRHASSLPDGVLFPGSYKQLPRIEVAIDTSGSMGAEQINLAATTIKPILKAFGGRCRVTSGDVGVQASKAVTFMRGKLELAGGGGTDMALLLDQIAARRDKREVPDIVVLVTDGQTPWPERFYRQFKVIVLLVGAPTGEIPAWLKVVDCTHLLKGGK